jgi:hypothetical protein
MSSGEALYAFSPAVRWLPSALPRAAPDALTCCDCGEFLLHSPEAAAPVPGLDRGARVDRFAAGKYAFRALA